MKAASLRATMFSSLVFLAACGGGGGESGGASQPQPSASGNSGDNSTNPSASAAPGGATSNTCQSQPIAGGDLFVVNQGPVKVTLLNNGGVSGGAFTFRYDNVFGIPTNNQQDKWGQATPFAPTGGRHLD